MSKESFSQNISEIMDKKIKEIETFNLKNIFEKDENFELAICLAYMSLSKEKIIAKDMKNNNRLGRLTQKVSTEEINKVFQEGFADEMPRILFAKENNNLWILDNIRDSIMHGACDIDEKKKCFIINNTQYDRELSAEIPFSWFVAYAKNDIFSQKFANNYTIRNYYYNKTKKDFIYFDTHKELVNNILYRVNIYGDKFNIKNIENRVIELFDIYSQEEITDEMFEKYKNQIDNTKIKYNEKYLVSFYIAKQKVIDTIEKEFPGVDLKIFIDNRKHKFVNKTAKKMPKYFKNYDSMFNSFNNELLPKGISLLRTMSRIVENFDTNYIMEEVNKTENLDFEKKTKILHKLLTGEIISDEQTNNFTMILNRDLNILRAIYLNVYGLSTLVINHETLYSPHFLNNKPSEFRLFAIQKKSYLDYVTKQKSMIMKYLDVQITLFAKKEQLQNCNDEGGKKKIQSNINDLNLKLKTLENELYDLTNTLGFEPISYKKEIDYKKTEQLDNIINQYYEHFYAAKSVDGKKKIKKILGELIDLKIEEESKYTYGYCNNMQDVLTIIRNCFSHIGRIHFGKSNGELTNIILNDYDNNGIKTGQLVCKYIDLIELLSNPYQVENQKVI